MRVPATPLLEPRLFTPLLISTALLCLPTSFAVAQETPAAVETEAPETEAVAPSDDASQAQEPDAAAPAGTPEAAASAQEAESDQPSKSDMAYGAFQRGYYLTALRLAKPLANLGDPAAQTLLGEIYSRGLGVPKDMEKAAKWYQAAAEAGSVEGQFRYALLLLAGVIVEKDVAKARDLMKIAADAGNPLAQFNYGQMLIQASPSGGFDEARVYFEKAADQGVADAQYALAQLYAYGRGVPTVDETVARSWLQSAAINGHELAAVELGIWTINGKGGPSDPERGFRWLLRAARSGNPIAMNRVAHLYKDGIGTAPDTARAAKWYVLARRANNTDAELDDFFRGLEESVQKEALEAANRFRAR